MHFKNWHTSPRRYGVKIECDVRIPVGGGIQLDADVSRPHTPGASPEFDSSYRHARLEARRGGAFAGSRKNAVYLGARPGSGLGRAA